MRDAGFEEVPAKIKGMDIRFEADRITIRELYLSPGELAAVLSVLMGKRDPYGG